MVTEKITVTDKKESAAEPANGEVANENVKEQLSPDQRALRAAEDSAAILSKQATKPGETVVTLGPEKTSSRDVSPLLGRVELNEDPDRKQLKISAIRAAADEIQKAAFNRNMWGWGFSAPDAEKIRNIIEPMNAEDRKRVEQEYAKNNPGHTLRGDLKEQFGANSENFLKLESILNRQDNKSDEAGQLRVAINKAEQAALRVDSRSGVMNFLLSNPFQFQGKFIIDRYQDAQDKIHISNAEADVLKSISVLSSAQIKELKETYGRNYKDENGQPVDLEKSLINDAQLSQAAKDALKILFLGIDKRTGSDPESIKNTLALAQIALDSKNIEIFKEAFQSTSPEARKQFIEAGGLARINEKFSGDERELAIAYAEQGSANIAHLIEGNSHWYRTNREEITRLVTNQATELDGQRYSKGKALSDSNREPANEEERKSLEFYRRLRKALLDAGSAREVALWESKLLKSPELVSKALESHTEANFIGFGKKTDRNQLFASVEKMSKEDWLRFKSNPDAELGRFEKALQTFADSQDVSKLVSMVKQKLTVDEYEKSDKLGRRSVEETVKDNPRNVAASLERLLSMSEEEKAAFLANQGGQQDRVRQALESQARTVLEKSASTKIFRQILEGKPSDSTDRAVLSAISGDSPVNTVRAVEQALKDNPALLRRPPASEADNQAQKNLRQALDLAVDKAGYGDVFIASHFGGTWVPGQQDKFAAKIFETGKMPLDWKLKLHGDDKLGRLNEIASASAEDKARLLEPNPGKETALFQNAVFGPNQDRDLYKFVIAQGRLTKADEIRAFVNGAKIAPEQLKADLDKMTPAERQALANEYFSKYKTLISRELIEKVPPQEKFRFRELLSPTDVHVRQIALDAREERHKHSSPADAAMNLLWDKSKLGADESLAKVDKFLKDHADEISKLSPEQRKVFLEAVGNYQQALKNYVDSKGAFAETVVDAAITVAAVGGAFFTGGTSLALLSAVGVGGATFRVVAMKAIQGTDFIDSPENLARQAFKGFIAAELGFIGPQQLGLTGLTKLGAPLALKTSENLLGKLATSTIFRSSSDATKAIIARELAAVSRQAAIIGGKESEAIVERISAQVLKEGLSPAEKALFQQALRQEMKEQVVGGIRNKLLNEAESYFLNVTAATLGNVGAEVLATAVGFEDPATLWQRAAGSAVAGLGGVTVFHFGFKGVSATFRGARAVLGKDSGGLFAGEGTIVRHADGSTRQVKSGEKYYFKKGDKVVQDLDSPGVPKDATGKETKGRELKADDEAALPKDKADKSSKDDGTARPAEHQARVEQKPGLDTADGRPLDTGRREFIQEKFKHLSEAERKKAVNAVINELKEVKAAGNASGADGSPLSVYEKLISDPQMSPDQKNRILDLLADVREHYASYRTPDGRMLADQEVNWIHTQGELAKVLESAQANKLSALETENALIASMFSDSAKFTDTALTRGNFTTHHLDGALAAEEALTRRGFPPERIKAITQAIREHQIAPPEFMGFIYHMTISNSLKAQLASGAIDQARFDQMKKVLDDMTVVGPDKMPRIKQIADLDSAPRVKNQQGEWEIAFSPEQRELMALTGAERWYLPHDPRFLADGKTPDPEFGKLPEAQQAARLSQYKSSRALIDGDGIDNYATVGGASKIVKIRGPETFFKDKTVWDSVASVDSSFNDALKVMTPEGQRLAQLSLAQRNRVLQDSSTGIRAKMNEWLALQGKNADLDKIPFYNTELKYPEALSAPESARLKDLQGLQAKAAGAERAAIDAEINSLKYKGLSPQEIADYEFAKKIRDQMTDFMRMAHRTDGSLPGRFDSSLDQPVDNALAAQMRDIEKGRYRPRVQVPDEAEIARISKEVPQLAKEVADDFSKRLSSIRESWTENLAPEINRANELAPQVNNAHKELLAELAKVKATDAEINAAKLDPNHRLNKEAGIADKYQKWKALADEHAGLQSRIKTVTDARARQVQDELDAFTSKHGLPKVELELAENMHAAGGYTFGKGKITIPRTALAEAGGSSGLNKVTFHELAHATAQDYLLVRNAIDAAARKGRAADSTFIKELYQEATGRQLDNGWLETVRRSSAEKPALSDAERIRANGLAKAVKESVTDVARRSEEFGNTARVIESKIQDLKSNSDGNAVGRLFDELLDSGGQNKLAARFFKTSPDEQLRKAAADWQLYKEGKLEGPFDSENARRLLLQHLDSELNRVNADHKQLIDNYSKSRIEREAYALSHQVHEPERVAGRDQSEPSAIRRANQDGQTEQSLPDAGVAPINESIGVSASEIRQNALASMERNRQSVLSANEQHIREVRAQRAQKGIPGKPGEAYQNEVYAVLNQRLQKLQEQGKVSKDWQIEPGRIGGTADNAKADYIMVNKKTGEVHILDATSNEAKAANESGRLSPLREQGIIKFDPQAFNYQAAANDIRSEQAMNALEADIDSMLVRLNQTRSDLILGETPFPSSSAKPDAATQIEDLKKLRDWLNQQGKPELRAYASEVQGGITYLENMLKTKVSTVVTDNISDMADKVNLRLALKKLTEKYDPQARSRPELREQFQSAQARKTQVHKRGNEEATIKDGDQNYIFNPEKSMKDSISRLTDSKHGDLLTKSQANRLRLIPALKEKSDAELNELMRRELQEMNRTIGLRIGDSKHVLGVDDLIQSIQQAETRRITEPKPEPQANAGGDRQVPEKLKAVKLAGESTELKQPEYDSLLADARAAWADYGLPDKIADSNKDDVGTFFEMLIGEKSGTWSAQQKALVEKLKSAYERGDKSAQEFLEQVLRAN